MCSMERGGCGAVWIDAHEIESVLSSSSQKSQEVRDALAKQSGIWLAAKDLKQQGTTEQKRLCPVDGTTITQIRYENTQIDQCGSCGGIWCDHEELRDIVVSREKKFDGNDFQDVSPCETKAKVVPGKSLAANLGCVVCGTLMTKRNYAYSSGILIDRCPNGHGVWLDLHELEKIQVFVERSDATQLSVSQKYQPVLAKIAREAEQPKKSGLSSESKNQSPKGLGILARILGN